MSRRKDRGSLRRKQLEKLAKRRELRAPAPVERPLFDPYEQALEQWEHGEPLAAFEALEGLHRRSPQRGDVLLALARLAHELRQFDDEVTYCEKLIRLEPENAEMWYCLGCARGACGRLAAALRAYQHAVTRWPTHEYSEGAWSNIELLEGMISREIRHHLPHVTDRSEQLELQEAHEQIISDLHARRYEQLVETAGQVLARHPALIPVRNNLTEALFHLGQLDRAIEIGQETVRLVPDNLYARASLARYLALDGRRDEALQLLDSLRDLSTDISDHVGCVARAYSLLGLDQPMLDWFARTETTMRHADALSRALLHHWAAVAESHLDRRTAARRHWEAALQLDPSLEIAAKNLADQRKRLAARHGAWAFELNQWINDADLRRIQAVIKSAKDRELYGTGLTELLREMPSLVTRLVMALQHGGPDACRFVFGMAKAMGPSPLVEPLYEFATGRRGSLDLRNEILSWLVGQKLTPGPTHRMWMDGEWREIKILQNEIYEEPETEHPPEVSEKAEEAFYLIHEDPLRAERLLREALELEPDAPDLWNNLAMALRMQGKHDEEVQILHDLQARFPDYFFGQIALAQEQIEDGRYDEATKVLARLIERPRLHVTEYGAVGSCYVRLFAIQGNTREAQVWLKRIEDVYPDYSELDTLRQIIQRGKFGERLTRRFEQWTKRLK